LWDKYRLPMLNIETDRAKAVDTLASYLKGMGYASS